MTDTAAVGATLRAEAQRCAQQLMAELAGVTAVVVATVDGFDVASCIRGDDDPSRIAAMASSISAIGGVISMEAGLGTYTSVTINTESGFAVVYAVARSDVELVVNVIANSDGILAQVTYCAARMVRKLASVQA